MDPLVIEKMIEQGRDGYEARLAAGQAWLKRGEADRALVHLERACETAPDRSMAWQELGRARLESGSEDGARQAWTRGIEVAAGNGDKQAEKVMSVWLRRLK
ncbi:MAG: tetratricopeptide repeat protein [Wenzhouxiangella sp.]|nr:MAG: tetratricopeptide repeat protein [Wenzhouxiangella sp.]